MSTVETTPDFMSTPAGPSAHTSFEGGSNGVVATSRDTLETRAASKSVLRNKGPNTKLPPSSLSARSSSGLREQQKRDTVARHFRKFRFFDHNQRGESRMNDQENSSESRDDTVVKNMTVEPRSGCDLTANNAAQEEREGRTVHFSKYDSVEYNDIDADSTMGSTYYYYGEDDASYSTGYYTYTSAGTSVGGSPFSLKKLGDKILYAAGSILVELEPQLEQAYHDAFYGKDVAIQGLDTLDECDEDKADEGGVEDEANQGDKLDEGVGACKSNTEDRDDEGTEIEGECLGTEQCENTKTQEEHTNKDGLLKSNDLNRLGESIPTRAVEDFLGVLFPWTTCLTPNDFDLETVVSCGTNDDSRKNSCADAMKIDNLESLRSTRSFTAKSYAAPTTEASVELVLKEDSHGSLSKRTSNKSLKDEDSKTKTKEKIVVPPFTVRNKFRRAPIIAASAGSSSSFARASCSSLGEDSRKKRVIELPPLPPTPPPTASFRERQRWRKEFDRQILSRERVVTLLNTKKRHIGDSQNKRNGQHHPLLLLPPPQQQQQQQQQQPMVTRASLDGKPHQENRDDESVPPNLSVKKKHEVWGSGVQARHSINPIHRRFLKRQERDRQTLEDFYCHVQDIQANDSMVPAVPSDEYDLEWYQTPY